MTSFTEAQLAYLASQRLGRLATVAPDGSPQNNPVGFRYNAELDTVDIVGYDLGNTRKFRNLRTNDRVALVIDDIASVTPWRVRCLEIRGTAEALTDQPRARPEMSAELIRIHPRRVLGFGFDEPTVASASGSQTAS
ncbi:MAG TPA: PPOX class F420-dependent oxidoreductase [Pseudonocardiaceae bacterium]|jgi:pyridoxamine 5'-phosphate oxidase family protein|nr:PPOX class F420-dependent oxidoreductase [Pseudonocardiaceae bacterium]